MGDDGGGGATWGMMEEVGQHGDDGGGGATWGMMEEVGQHGG